jgi:hypothetical protein
MRRPITVMGILLASYSASSTPAGAPLKEVYVTSDRFVVVKSDDPAMDVATAKDVAVKIGAVWKWLMDDEQEWPNKTPLRAPIEVRVLTRVSSTELGEAVHEPDGKQYFKIALHYLKSQPELAEGTLAHELTHYQDVRELAPEHIPGFIAEGRGLSDGFFYRKHLGFPPQPYDKGLAHAVVAYTAAQVEEVVSREEWGDLRDPQANLRLEFIGCWFLEYLRTGYGAKGFADVQPRLARMITFIHQGVTFEPAFKKAFEVDFQTVRKAFVAHATKVKGAARLKGTIWEGLVE